MTMMGVVDERIMRAAVHYADPVIVSTWGLDIIDVQYHQITDIFIMVEREYATLLTLQHGDILIFEVVT